MLGLNRKELISLYGLPDKHSHSYINGNVKIEELIFNNENRGSLNAILIDDIVKSATYDKSSKK